jgi:hypothetical protein
MRHVLSVGLQDRDIQQTPFKKCIIEALGRGKITLAQLDLDSLVKEMFHHPNAIQRKRGRVQG